MRMQLFHALVYDGLRADVLHAERTAAQREATVSKFRTDGGGGRGERRWHVMVSCVYSCMPSCAAACKQSHTVACLPRHHLQSLSAGALPGARHLAAYNHPSPASMA